MTRLKPPIQLAYERRNPDLDPQLVWRGKDQEPLEVSAPPLYIQEKVHPKAIIDDLLRQSRSRAGIAEDGYASADLFADFNGLPEQARSTEFYRHEGHWSNRMILGDSLQVMASLAEREGLRGKVQCIYLDPPYGIKFNSNFQWSTTSRDVKDGNADHLTREPEQVKAFRDTWRDGIHSYLTYLRDRLLVARDLLTESGSIFVQIGDENLEWKTPATKAGRLIEALVAAIDADTVCYTEVVRTMIPEGHSIESDPDYGYPNDGGRRKVILWSKQPWTDVDTMGDDEMPSGRFVSGITAGVRFVGVCIPWRDAHVTTGRRDRTSWEDHLAYCRGLERVLARYSKDRSPTCVVGDYNQRIPRVGQPVHVARALADAIPADFMIATEGLKDADGADLIDHFVVSPDLSISITQIVPRFSQDGTRLSDHVGVAASLEKRRSEPQR